MLCSCGPHCMRKKKITERYYISSSFIINMYKTFASAEFKKGPLHPTYKEQFNTILEKYNLWLLIPKHERTRQVPKDVLNEYFTWTGGGLLMWKSRSDTEIWNDLWALQETQELSYDVNGHPITVSEKTFLDVFEWLYPLIFPKDLNFSDAILSRRKERKAFWAKKVAQKERKIVAERAQEKRKNVAERDRLIKRWKPILEGKWRDDHPWHNWEDIERDRWRAAAKKGEQYKGVFSYRYNKKLKKRCRSWVTPKAYPVWKTMPDNELIQIFIKMSLKELRWFNENMPPIKTEDQLEKENIESLRKEYEENVNSFGHRILEKKVRWKEAVEKYRMRKRDERFATNNATPADKKEAEKEAEEAEEVPVLLQAKIRHSS